MIDLLTLLVYLLLKLFQFLLVNFKLLFINKIRVFQKLNHHFDLLILTINDLQSFSSTFLSKK